MGRVDELRGFKENVILGHLIPGGTGFPLHHYLKLVPLGEPVSDEVMEELRKEKQAKLDAIFGATPPPNEDEEDDDSGAFPVDSKESESDAFEVAESLGLVVEAEEDEQ